MSDSQLYTLKLYLINNEEYKVGFFSKRVKFQKCLHCHDHYLEKPLLKIIDFSQKTLIKPQSRPELTRVRSIWFLLFEIKRVLVNNSTIFKLTDLFISCFCIIQNVYADISI